MSEPILWVKHAESMRRIPARRFDEASGQMAEVFDDDTGERVFEKVPQRGHVGGDYENPVVGRPTWMLMLRHDGHEVRHKLTCAAADYDMSQLTSQERRAKARYLGWIPVGHCPVALVMAGEVKAGQLVAKELRSQTSPCVHGSYSEHKHCPHYVIEAKARRALNGKKQVALNEKMRPEAEKMIEAQREQTKAIVGGVSEAVAHGIAEALKPKGGKGG